MIRPGEFLAANGPMLLAGATAWLGVGTVALRLLRSPVRRQRAAEMTVLCVLVWGVLACLPLPRWSPRMPSHPEPTPVSTAGSEDARLPSDWQAAVASVSRQSEEGVQRSSDSTLRFSDGGPRGWDDRGHPDVARAMSPVFTAGVGSRIALVYLICVAGCAARLLLGHMILWRLVLGATRPEPWLRELFEEVCHQVGLRRRARLLVVRTGVRPASCGIVRPTVLVGEEECRPSSRSRLRQVLLHEAAHLRQHDAWGNALFNLAMPLLWLHPLYWLLWSETSLARELVADDVAAACSSRTAYATDLLELAWLRLGYHPAPSVSLGIFRSPSHLYRRLHMLVHRNTRLESRCPSAWKFVSGTTFALTLMAASATFGVRPAAAADPAVTSAGQSSQSPAESTPAATTPPPSAFTAAPETDPNRGSRDSSAEVSRLKAELDAARDKVERLSRELDEAKPSSNKTTRALRGASRWPSLGHITFRYDGEGGSGAILAFDSQTKKLMWRIDVPLNADSVIQCNDNETLLIKSADGYTRLVTSEEGKLIRAWAPGVEVPAASSERSVNPFNVAAAPPSAGQRSSSTAAPARTPALAPAVGLPSRAVASAAGVGPAPAVRSAPVPAPAPRSADPESLNTAVGSLHPQLDLVALADRYSDAVSAAAAAQEDLATSSADPRERGAAKAKFTAAERKAKLFRSIADAALAQAEKEHALAEERVSQGVAPAGAIVETEGRLRILALILKSGNEAKPADGPGQ